MRKTVSEIFVSLVVLVVLLAGVGWLVGIDFGRSVPSAVLTPDLDSEKLLYDDAFMDEAIRTHTLRSLTASLSRLGYAKGIDCHNRAHEMGRRAYEMFGGESFKDCGIECHSGCRHGATEAFFAANGTSDLVGSLAVLCGDEAGNKFHMHQCIHGIGHGLMAWYDYALYDALEACDLINHPFHQASCYSGVFMENIVGSIVNTNGSGEGQSVGHHTKYLSDDPHYPCNAVADKYKYQCYWLQTDRMLQLGGPDSIGTACAEAPEPFQFSCFHSMGRSVSAHFSRDPEKNFSVCNAVPDTADKDACLEGVLSDLFWDETQADRAVKLCALSQDSSFERQCYDQLIVRASEVVPENTIGQFCKKLPDIYHDQCVYQKTPQAFPLSTDSAGFVSPDVRKTNGAIIRYADGRYVPDTVHISVGQEVVWVNESDALFWPASNIHPTHAAYPGSSITKCGTSEQQKIFDACKAHGSGVEYSFVFTEEGMWRYHDHINPRAVGTVIVSE